MKQPSKWFLLQNPMIFQGWKMPPGYFEGWYYKVTDPLTNLAMAVIPGISIDKNGDKHAFIQVIDGIACRSSYYRFAVDAFEASRDSLVVQIGENQFSERSILLSLPDLTAKLEMSSWAKLPSTSLNPGIMGWYSFVPWMQCYHGLGSMTHMVQGSLNLFGQNFHLKEAKGYVEKDWGRSFPKAWIWTQCNSFENNDDLSVFASVAHIPWMGSYFVGFLATIHIGQKVEVFATYNRSTKSAALNDSNVILRFKKRNHDLEIVASRENGSDLMSPISGEMKGKVNESLQASVILTYKIGNKVVVQDSGSLAGLEVAGPVEILIDTQ